MDASLAAIAKQAGQRCVDPDMVIFQIAAHEREHLADQRIDVKGGARRAAMPENQVDFLDKSNPSLPNARSRSPCSRGGVSSDMIDGHVEREF